MTERYSLSRRVLHWLSAAVILWATASGFTSALATLPPVVEQTIGAFNVALTLLFIPVFGLRLWLAVSGHKPSTPGLSRRQQRTAAAGHWLIYSAVVLVLFSGFSMMERPMTVFGLFELAPWLPPSAATRFFSHLHHYSCALLALLVAGHIAAVLLHQQRGVRVMSKML